MLMSSKCVLMLSDEGLNVYEVSSSKAALVDTVPWETEDFAGSVSELLGQRLRGKPITLFNDMVEQHYRKERIPKVSMMDRANVVERRLTAAFQSYPMRASMKLKDASGTKPGATAVGETYLFAAVPLSDNVRNAFSSIQRSHSSFHGFGLLPVESASMVQALSKKLRKPSEPTCLWTVFVGQHSSGGLRQVVIRNGELALTRMTPIIDSDADPDVWASDVVAEIKGTMSYLSRFGFDPSDGLDVIVISGNSSAEFVSSRIDFDCNLHVLSAGEAGKLLGLRIGPQKEQRYADPLHVAWLAKKSKLTLPIKSALINQLSRPAKIAMVAMLVLVAVCGELGYRTYNSFSMLGEASSGIAAAQGTLEQTRTEHAGEIELKKAAGVDFERIDKATKTYKMLDAQGMKPLVMLDTIGRALGPDISLESLSIRPLPVLAPGDPAYVDPSTVAVTEDGSGDALNPPKQDYEVVLRIVFPQNLDPKIGVQEVNGFFERLKKAMPNHDIAIIKQVADLSYTGNYVGESTVSGNNQTDQPLEAELLIKGAML